MRITHDLCIQERLCVIQHDTRFIFTEEDSMTKLGRSKTIRFLVFGVLVLAATSCAQKRSSVPEQIAKTSGSAPEQIAKTYGLDSFGQIEAIRYRWNAQFPGVNVSRSWVWEPKT